MKMHNELRHLKEIKAVNQASGLAEAADTLHIPQSALIHKIKGLEDQPAI